MATGNTADLDFSDLTGEDHGVSGSHDEDGASSQSEGMCTSIDSGYKAPQKLICLLKLPTIHGPSDTSWQLLGKSLQGRM